MLIEIFCPSYRAARGSAGPGTSSQKRSPRFLSRSRPARLESLQPPFVVERLFPERVLVLGLDVDVTVALRALASQPRRTRT
jgi:hypothetical protein